MTAAHASWNRALSWRLFLTVWLVYSVFATTNVVRETYLAVSLGEQGTVRVDKYRDLHPDLFEFPGRGWYINSNPGASILGAVPYALLVRPAIAVATRLRPGIAEPKPPATYDDPRPNRTRFMNAARARGLDVVLGLAALGTGVTLMAPLGALAAVFLFQWLRGRVGDDRRALGLALLYALATPALFRAAFINQNAILAHLVLGAWILMTGLSPRAPAAAPGPRSLAGIGALLGYGLVCDYSAIPFLVVFGCWILRDGYRRGGAGTALRDGATYAAGAFACIAILLGYQWAAFGNPLWPAQRYMPPTEFSVRGWLGFTLPTGQLLVGNLLDPRYGLFAYSPLLLAAAVTPFMRRHGGAWMPDRSQLAWIGACLVALLLFSSSTQFANLQWNTGVRYMVPVAPLLFLAAVPALSTMPRPARWSLAGATLAISLAVSMTREDIPTAFRFIASEGPTLPVLLVMRRMASGYDFTVPWWGFWLVALVVAVVLAMVWRPVLRRANPS